MILGVKLHDDIPETDRFFEAYGPSFELSIGKGRRPNRNSDVYIRDTIKLALSKFQNTSNCDNAKCFLFRSKLLEYFYCN